LMPPPPPEVVEEEEPEEDTGIMLAAEPEPEEEEPEEEVIPQNPPVTTEFMMGLEMLIPPNLLNIVHKDFESAGFEARAIPYLSDIGFYQKAVRELFPESKERNDALDGLALGFLDFPSKINSYSFLFSKLPMKWHDDYQSFVSTEQKNGLISIAGKGLNKQVECYVELRLPTYRLDDAPDDRLYVLLKSPSGLSYFFGFRQGILSITSNNTIFMQQLDNMKEKELITKMPDGENFEIQSVEYSTAKTFLRRISAVQ
ncbi:MAG: hypothetical protein AAGJ82_10205, partial [Bacteroidota bacterium]